MSFQAIDIIHMENYTTGISVSWCLDGFIIQFVAVKYKADKKICEVLIY